MLIVVPTSPSPSLFPSLFLCVCVSMFIDFLLWPHEALLKMRFSRFLLPCCRLHGAGRGDRERGNGSVAVSGGYCLVLAIVISAWHVVVAFDADFKLPLAWLALSPSLPLLFPFSAYCFTPLSETTPLPAPSARPTPACMCQKVFLCSVSCFPTFSSVLFCFLWPLAWFPAEAASYPAGQQQQGGGGDIEG